jgi:tRNA-splicing ligase RtcB
MGMEGDYRWDERRGNHLNKPIHIYGEEYIEHGAFQQFYSAMELDWVRQGALMPDAHQGYTLPIGGVVATDGVVVPAWVGYDIGCGMCAVPTNFDTDRLKLHAKEIFDAIYVKIPVGYERNKRPVTWREYGELPKTEWFNNMFYEKGGLKQLGTLGGGNHFIEVGTGQDGTVWVIVHSGSRNVGHSTATYYMREASFIHTGKRKAREWHYGFQDGWAEYEAYIMDLKVCEAFALKNREEIIRRVVEVLQIFDAGDGAIADMDNLINRNHNHIEFDNDHGIIHRKGATHARTDMYGVIPGNMLDGSFIVRGLGNPDSLFSSSHGAGRILSRKKAKGLKENGEPMIPMEDFVQVMDGITAKVDEGTKDESPFAYKDIFTVMDLQRDLVEVVDHIKPFINIKG